MNLSITIKGRFNPSTEEAETGRSLSSRPAYRVSFRIVMATLRNPNNNKAKETTAKGWVPKSFM
jgi:hypothetical protein